MPKNFLLTIMFGFILTGCSTEYSAVYQSVTAESKWDEADWITIAVSTSELPLYKVENNKLYLMIRGTHTDRLFHTVVSYPSWDETEINSLLQQHADIRKLMPLDWHNWLPKDYGDECKGKGEGKA